MRPSGTVASTVRDTLYAATLEKHRAIETTGIARAMVASAVQPQALADLLQGYRTAWAQIDAHWQHRRPQSSWSPVARVPLIDADLAWLRANASVRTDTGAAGDALMRCMTAVLGTPAELGAFYVLEGSALGGAVLRKRLEIAGLGGATRFHTPYGDQPRGPVFAYFEHLERAVSPELLGEVTQAAVDTFDAIYALHDAVTTDAVVAGRAA